MAESPLCVESFWRAGQARGCTHHAGDEQAVGPVYDKPMIYYPLSLCQPPRPRARLEDSGARKRSPGDSGFITDDELRERAELLVKSGYGDYLLDLLDRAGDDRI